jgi:hypothetical protein
VIPGLQDGTPFTIRHDFDHFMNVPCAEDHVIGSVRYTEVDPVAGTERVLLELQECVPIPWPLEGTESQALGEPSAVNIRDAVSRQLPLPVLAINPHVEGLTGLDTWLWYEDDGASALMPINVNGQTRPGLQVTATAGPFSITAEAWIIEYRWDMGDGGRYASNSPGSEDHPAATHLYEVKGNYTVQVETVWTGTYTWTASGTTGSGDLGSVVRRSEHPYTVVEARAVLTR